MGEFHRKKEAYQQHQLRWSDREATRILLGFFEVWMKWRDEETSVSKKTIKENRFLYNALLQRLL